jgi:NADP-reducing hydrogenase subunit HndB
MKRMTLDDLRKHRDAQKKELGRRETEGKTRQVIIGMGTCGIAAGAKASFDAFLQALENAGMDDVVVKQTGCMGLCYSEPTVEVVAPGMPTVVYGKVDADTARRIVEEHLDKGRLVDDHIYDKPAADIIH